MWGGQWSGVGNVWSQASSEMSGTPDIWPGQHIPGCDSGAVASAWLQLVQISECPTVFHPLHLKLVSQTTRPSHRQPDQQGIHRETLSVLGCAY